MKTLFAVIGLILIAVLAASIIMPLANLLFLPPDSRYQAALVSEQIRREQMFTSFMTWIYGIVVIGAISIVGLIVGGLITAAVLAYRKRRDRDARQEDGSLAVRPRTVKIWSEKLGKMVRTTSIPDMNQIVGNSMTWNPDQGCWIESHGGAGWDRQLIVARDNALKARTQAAITGDQAYGNASRNFADGGARVTIKNQPPPAGFFNALKPPAYQEQRYIQEPAPEPTIEATPVSPPTFKEAWAASKPQAWVLGYSTDPKTAGSLATFDIKADCNIGIIGSPGTGKTTAAYHVLALALRYGHQVVILDGKGGADLKVFSPYTDYQVTDGLRIQNQIAALHHEFERRQKLLNANDASDIDELNAKGVALPRMFICIEEFGSIWDEVPAANRPSILVQLQNLLLQSRYCGMHYCCIDHRPKAWPDALLNALKFKIVFQSDSRQAGAVREYDAPGLRNIGEFVRYRTVYQAWNGRTAITRNLAKIAKAQQIRILPPPQTAPLILGEPSAEPIPTHPEVSAGFTNIINETAESRDPARHDALFAEWFAQEPARWQRDQSTKNGNGTRELSRLMAAWDNEHYGTNRDPNDLVGAANAKLIEWRLRGAPPNMEAAPTAQAMAEIWNQAPGTPIIIGDQLLADPRERKTKQA